MSLKQCLLDADLGLTEADFETHESDLYVLAKPGVIGWLNANYKWAKNVTTFHGAKGSDWAGRLAVDIPFANEDWSMARGSTAKRPKS